MKKYFMKQVTYSPLKIEVLSAFPLVIETIPFTSTEIAGVIYMRWFFIVCSHQNESILSQFSITEVLAHVPVLSSSA